MTAPTLKATTDSSANSGAQAAPSTQGSLESAILGTYKRAPVELVRGSGVYLYDAEGKSYLDFGSGIAVNSLGYDDPGLKAALHAASEGLIHTSNLYHTAPGERLAATLVARSFASKVFFCNSGAEANEGAFKFARRARSARRSTRSSRCAAPSMDGSSALSPRRIALATGSPSARSHRGSRSSSGI
jgi:acetylornithine/succinyldiaminopimelate/putrescine aminotransferase